MGMGPALRARRCTQAVGLGHILELGPASLRRALRTRLLPVGSYLSGFPNSAMK